MKRTHKQNGITLVALVITIIILLILAGISISALTNQGLFTQAQNAKNLTEEKTAEENAILANYLEQIEAITGGTTYTAYVVGDQVTVGGESFYVIKASGTSEEKVTLLAAKNIVVDSSDPDTYLTQGDSSGTVTFCTDPDETGEGYWTSISGITYPYDLNNVESERATAINYAKAYAESITGNAENGRLMTVEEVVALGGDATSSSSTSACPSWINTSNYWLGSAVDTDDVWLVDGEGSSLSDDALGLGLLFGVRPVIEISKSLIS